MANNNQKTNYELAFNRITKETEKAVCLNLMVSWNGTCKDKDLWFPKSQVQFVTFTDSQGIERTNALVPNWLIWKMEQNNAFNGYQMHFETLFN